MELARFLGTVDFLADESFNRCIERGLRCRELNLDVVLVREVGLEGEHDRTKLEWAF